MEDDAIATELERLRLVESEQKTTESLQISDFCKCIKSYFFFQLKIEINPSSVINFQI